MNIMKRVLFLVILHIFSASLPAEELMMFTANQYFMSRIYTLSTNGTVQNYFSYDNYHFCDMEVVNNELYAAEAFAPRVYKIDIDTGDLEVIIDDWSLFYFYDIAFDGTYFYVTEWDLNRYDVNGNYEGTVSFNEDVFGSAWDGEYLWMLNDEAQIKCWDVALWPNLIEITANAFSPPSDSCRGLWFDGTYFWTTEGLDGSLGYIYQFDYSGEVIDQILAPAWVGFGVCKLDQGFAVDETQQYRSSSFLVTPNPFVDEISISCTLRQSGNVVCEIFDIRGMKLEILSLSEFTAGEHVFRLEIRNLKSGIYFLKFTSGNSVEIQKIIHLKQ